MSRCRSWVLALVAGLALFALGAGSASATSSTTVQATYESPEFGWAKVERLYDSSPGFTPTYWPGSDTRMDQFGQRKTFFGGEGRPASGKFLLYYGKNWSTNTKATPVLLIPGAFAEADGTWADPQESHLTCGNVEGEECPSTGLMQRLASHNYKTFAVSFNNGAGNNYNWAEVIYDAIQRIKAVTKAPKVDIIAWSKGTVAARMYVSSMKESWGTSYAGDVRKMILAGGMGGGWDLNFRHGRNPTYLMFPECDYTGQPQPLAGSAETAVYCYPYYNAYHPELSIYKEENGEDPFVGLRQMLANLTATHPLNYENLDEWTTYYGGWGYLYGSYSKGLPAALEETPGSVIPGLRTTYTVPSTISTYLLCGTKNDIPGFLNEEAESDGIIFTDSCDDQTGIGKVPIGGNVKLPLNHMQLVWNSSAASQMESWLE